jgi:hypothetical protein
VTNKINILTALEHLMRAADREPIWSEVILVIAPSEAENRRVIVDKGVETMQRFCNGAAIGSYTLCSASGPLRENTGFTVSLLLCIFCKNHSFYKTTSNILLDIREYRGTYTHFSSNIISSRTVRNAFA